MQVLQKTSQEKSTQKLTLFSITEDLKILEQLEQDSEVVDTTTGEITINEESVLEELKADTLANFDKKVVAYRNTIKYLENQILFCSQETARIKKYSNSLEKSISRMKSILLYCMEVLKKDKVDLPTGQKVIRKQQIKYNYSEPVLLEKHPDFFRKEYKLDKRQAKEAFKNHQITEGISTESVVTLWLK
ncbi:MAG: hypothetical protein GY830_07810 [Bacteroidetes bacterium]|nr:hypothetical protein [Bacteroidota bacterium]